MARIWEIASEIPVGAAMTRQPGPLIVYAGDGNFYWGGDPDSPFRPTEKDWDSAQWVREANEGLGYSTVLPHVLGGTYMRRVLWPADVFLTLRAGHVVKVLDDGTVEEYVIGADWNAYDWEVYNMPVPLPPPLPEPEPEEPPVPEPEPEVPEEPEPEPEVPPAPEPGPEPEEPEPEPEVPPTVP